MHNIPASEAPCRTNSLFYHISLFDHDKGIPMFSCWFCVYCMGTVPTATPHPPKKKKKVFQLLTIFFFGASTKKKRNGHQLDTMGWNGMEMTHADEYSMQNDTYKFIRGAKSYWPLKHLITSGWLVRIHMYWYWYGIGTVHIWYLRYLAGWKGLSSAAFSCWLGSVTFFSFFCLFFSSVRSFGLFRFVLVMFGEWRHLLLYGSTALLFTVFFSFGLETAVL